MTAIHVERLTKSFAVKMKQAGLAGSMRSLFKPQYSEKAAVTSIDLSIGQGESVAFLGPNGAGKSTTIKMLTGILHPTSGKANVLGYCPWTERKQLAFHVGSVFGQKSQLWYHLPPVDTFELMSRIYELKRSDFYRRRDELIERFELGAYMNTPVRKLSLGERMRCEIAAALLHRPRIIFLDEPTIGLDVVVKHKIRELISEMNREEGTTVFLTSHDPGDIERLCDRAVVINHGTVILDEKVAVMKRRFLTHKIVNLKLAEPAASFSFPGARLLEHEGDALRLAVDTGQIPIETVLAEIVRSCRIADVTIEDPPMEEIIAHIYAGRQTAWNSE